MSDPSKEQLNKMFKLLETATVTSIDWVKFFECDKPSVDSVKVTQPSFQMVEGGATPTSTLHIKDMKVYNCEFKDISHIFERYHYKGKNMGGGISVCFKLVYKSEIVGGAVLGKPRHLKKYPDCIDIRRMALIDECPKNSESYFLGKVVQWIKRYTDYKRVLSYADASVGHKGTIYKASNFINVGETSPSKAVFYKGKRYHPRSLSIDRPYSYELREAVKKGDAEVVVGLPKSIWIYNIKD